MPLRLRLRGCGSLVVLALLCFGGLALWAVSGTLGLDGPPVPPAPAVLSEQRGSFDLTVEPLDAMIDEPVSILLSGLERGETVILRARTSDSNGVQFASWARFEADTDGTLDLSTTPPAVGTYEGIDPGGLLWSMRGPNQEQFVTDAGWTHREYFVRAETSRGIRETRITRRYPWSGTVREEITAGSLVAELSYRPSAEPQPVIVLLGGWDDGPSPLTAALLAARGFAVLNVGYHAWPGTPERLVEIPVETISVAIDWIENDTRLDSARVGIYGISKGAELALLAASHDPRLRAVAAWVPSSIAFAGVDFRDRDPGSSWTFEGEPVPYATAPPGIEDVRNTLRFLLRRPMVFRPAYERALERAPDQSVLKVERIAGPVLLVSGTDDQVWPSAVMAQQVADRLAALRPTAVPVQNLIFDQAGHGINSSLWPSGGRRTGFFWRGGTASIDHRAGQIAWRSTLEFFRREL